MRRASAREPRTRGYWRRVEAAVTGLVPNKKGGPENPPPKVQAEMAWI
jgi:hypothetical protein